MSNNAGFISPNFPGVQQAAAQRAQMPGAKIPEGNPFIQAPPQGMPQSSFPGMGNMPVPGMGGSYIQNQDPMAQLGAILRSNSYSSDAQTNAFGGQQAGFSWDTVEKKPQFDAQGIDQFVQGDGSGSQPDLIYDAKLRVIPVIIEIIKDVSYRTSGGKAELLNVAMQEFIIDTDMNFPMPAAAAFIEFVMQQPKLRIMIATHSAIYLANLLVDLLVGNAQDVNVSRINAECVRCMKSILLLEMANWATRTQRGREYYPGIRNTAFLMNRYNRLPVLIDKVGAAFQRFDMPQNPYEGTSIQMRVQVDQSSRAEQYRVNLDQEIVDFGQSEYRTQTSISDEDNELMRRCREQALKTYRETHQAVKQNTNEFKWTEEEQVIKELNRDVSSRYDFENITSSNRSQFDYRSQFTQIGDTNWYIPNYPNWKHLKKAWKPGPGMQPTGSNWTDLLIVNIDFINDTGWYTREIKLTNGMTEQMALSDPALLLPLLVKNREGQVVTFEQKREEELRERDDLTGAIHYIPLPDCAELRYKPVCLNKSEPLVTESSQRISFMSEEFYRFHEDRNSKELFAASMATKSVTPYIMDDEDEAGEIYLRLGNLVKGASTRVTNYFDWARNILRQCMGPDVQIDPGFGAMVDDFLSHEFHRWVRDCRGYGTRKHKAYFIDFGSLAKNLDDVQEWMRENDRETYYALTQRCDELTRLIKRSQCIMPKEEAAAYVKSTLTNDPDAVLGEALGRRTVYFVRELVVTRISKMMPPTLDDDEDCVRVKRSNFPEIFALVEACYGQTSEQMTYADMILTFDRVDGSMWTFTTSDYDKRNVATLRRVGTRKPLTFLDV